MPPLEMNGNRGYKADARSGVRTAARFFFADDNECQTGLTIPVRRYSRSFPIAIAKARRPAAGS